MAYLQLLVEDEEGEQENVKTPKDEKEGKRCNERIDKSAERK